MARKFINPYEDSACLNSTVFNDYYNRLKMLALSLYEWKNLPPGMNARFLEKTLYRWGIALMFRDEGHPLIYLNTRCTPGGMLNIYNEPVSYTAFATNYTKTLALDECAVVRNNPDMVPTQDTLMLYAYRLYEAEMTASINVRAQKTPVLIKCDEKERLTLKNLYLQYDGNMPVIYGDKGLNSDALKVLKTDAPYLADKLTIYKHEIWNEAMTFLGINNANTDKKERLITDEAEANNQLVSISAQAMLMCRQEAAERFNELYGTDVSCVMRQPQRSLTAPQDYTAEEEDTDE